MRNRPTRLFFALLIAVFLAACGSKLTEENFAKIETGMTVAEVTEILGEPTETKSADFLGMSGTSAVWRDEGKLVSIQFFNEKVRLKQMSRE